MKILDVPRSGSYAGITSSKNRFGQYVRNRRAPVQPIGTGRRAFIRAAFGAASSAWAALTPDQQAAWDSFAEGHPVVNTLGASVVLTGHQMFVAVATQRQNIGDDIGTDPPASTETPTLSDVILTADLAPTLSIAFSKDVEGAVLIAACPPLSSGRRFPTRFWQANVASGSAGPTTADIRSIYTTEFGALVLGQRIFVKLTPVNGEGWTGTPTVVSTQVAAAPGP